MKPRIPFACAFAGLLLPACLDLSSPAYRDPYASSPDASDASVVDAARDAISDVANNADALAAACNQCLANGACSSFYTPCTANKECASLAMCLTDTSCWSSSLTDLTHLSPCLIQCAVKAGISSQSDPASLLISPLNDCARDPSKCGRECAPSLVDM